MKVLAIIQARMSSTRLPGKVLEEILGRPMLEMQIERLRRAGSFDQLVVATSDHGDDDAVETLCREIGVACFRGSLDDVLARFHFCAVEWEPEHVVRLTGDCPLSDPAVIDQVVRFHLDGGYDYTSNIEPPTWPDGLDVEIMRYAALIDAHAEAELPSEREHVTLFIRNRPERYRIGNLEREPDLSAHRLTVDEPEDMVKICRIFERLYPENPEFIFDDVMALLDGDAALAALNAHIGRNEGMRRSAEKDVEHLACKDKHHA
jgi:spore coat polysaccharide biosynthesis protein SpsF